MHLLSEKKTLLWIYEILKSLIQTKQNWFSFSRQPRVSLISGSSETAPLMIDQTSDPTWWAKQEAHFKSIRKGWVAHLFLILIIIPNRVFSAVQGFRQMNRKSENNIHEHVAHTVRTKRRNRCLSFACRQNGWRGHSRELAYTHKQVKTPICIFIKKHSFVRLTLIVFGGWGGVTNSLAGDSQPPFQFKRHVANASHYFLSLFFPSIPALLYNSSDVEWNQRCVNVFFFLTSALYLKKYVRKADSCEIDGVGSRGFISSHEC